MRCALLQLPLFAAISAVVAIVTPPHTAKADQPAVKVSGGGTATFDFVEGLQSQFAVSVAIRDDGSAEGTFMCMITGVVTVVGEVDEGLQNPDGSVTVSGIAHGIDHAPEFFGPFEDCPFEVTLFGGGPGVGGFLYSDCVVLPPGDAETVATGHIFIHEP